MTSGSGSSECRLKIMHGRGAGGCGPGKCWGVDDGGEMREQERRAPIYSFCPSHTVFLPLSYYFVAPLILFCCLLQHRPFR
jgi:hypothetical protein